MATLKYNKKTKKYEVRYDAGFKSDGRRNQKFKSFDKKCDAEEFLAEKVLEVKRGIYIEPQRTLISNYLTDWLAEQKNRLSPTTFSGYEVNIRCHINPIIGGVRLQEVKPRHIRKLHKELQKDRTLVIIGEGGKKEKRAFKALSATSVLYVHRVLSKALEDAVNDELIMKNPAKLVKPPAPEKYNASFLTAAQIRDMLHKFRESNDELYIPVMLAVMLGLRRGEVLGLQWQDIDFINNIIRVRRNYTMANGEPILREKTKTDSSRRDISVTTRLMSELKEYRKNRKIHNFDFVCTWADGQPFNPSHISRSFGQRLEKYGLPKVRFHDLRHSNASLMIGQGAPMKGISDRLGHSTIVVSQDLYGHIEDSIQRQIAESIDRAIWGE